MNWLDAVRLQFWGKLTSLTYIWDAYHLKYFNTDTDDDDDQNVSLVTRLFDFIMGRVLANREKTKILLHSVRLKFNSTTQTTSMSPLL